MVQLNVTLPESTAEFVESQLASGNFATPSEYLGYLIEQARATAAKQQLDSLLDEGLNSGQPIQFSDAWWRKRKAELLTTLPAESVE